MNNSQQAEIKRFVAPTMSRALDLVRQDMGPEAIILSSKKVTGGIEIITSIEPDLPTRGVDERRDFGQKFDGEMDQVMDSDSAWRSQAGIAQAAAGYSGKTERNGPAAGFGAGSVDGKSLADEIERARERMLAAKRREQDLSQHVSSPAAPTRQPAFADIPPSPVANTHDTQRSSASNFASIAATQEQEHKLQSLQSELEDMRLMLEQQMWQMAKNQTSPVSGMPSQIKMPQGSMLVNQHLTRLGLPEFLVAALVAEVNANQRPSDAWRHCMARLAKQIPVTQNVVAGGGAFAFVGQTGVGKTTTIAKLAAQYVLDHGPGRVALVTTDTYRVGALDQLKSLGKILNVPVRAVDNDNSLMTVLASLRQFDLILIDTAGFRHGDPVLKAQLSQLDTCPAVKRLLVMSSNSQLQTMKASLHAYASRRGIDACVISKLDETASLGEALSVVVESHLPVAYFTDGQEIPQDISVASGAKLVARAVSIMKSDGMHASTTVSG